MAGSDDCDGGRSGATCLLLLLLLLCCCCGLSSGGSDSLLVGHAALPSFCIARCLQLQSGRQSIRQPDPAVWEAGALLARLRSIPQPVVAQALACAAGSADGARMAAPEWPPAGARRTPRSTASPPSWLPAGGLQAIPRAAVALSPPGGWRIAPCNPRHPCPQPARALQLHLAFCMSRQIASGGPRGSLTCHRRSAARL
jgi:hypothetical protein